MALTDGEWKAATSWIGEGEARVDFDERVDRLAASADSHEEAINLAIEESLRAQLAVLSLNTPTSMSLPGGIAASFGENIRAIRETLKTFMSSRGSGRARVVVRRRATSGR